MTDQKQASETTRKGAAETPPGFDHGRIDKERMVLALIGLAGAAVIVAMNVG